MSLTRRPGVQQYDIQNVAVDVAGTQDANRRNAKPFLKDRAAYGRLAARDHATDVGMMRNVGDIGDDLVTPEHRRDDVDVREMRSATGIGIVGNEHIARPHLIETIAL